MLVAFRCSRTSGSKVALSPWTTLRSQRTFSCTRATYGRMRRALVSGSSITLLSISTGQIISYLAHDYMTDTTRWLTISNKRLPATGGSTIHQVFSTCKQAGSLEAVFLPWVYLLDTKRSKVINKLRREIIYWVSKIQLIVYGRGWGRSKHTSLCIFGRFFRNINRNNFAGREPSSSWRGKKRRLLEPNRTLRVWRRNRRSRGTRYWRQAFRVCVVKGRRPAPLLASQRRSNSPCLPLLSLLDARLVQETSHALHGCGEAGGDTHLQRSETHLITQRNRGAKERGEKKENQKVSVSYLMIRVSYPRHLLTWIGGGERSALLPGRGDRAGSLRARLTREVT